MPLINIQPMFEMVLRRIADAPEVVVDVETSGLSWHNNHIVAWVITVGPGPDDTFYIPVRHAGGGNLPSTSQVPTTALNWHKTEIHPADARIIKALKGKKLIFHHGSFDMGFMAECGWRADDNTTADTMIAAYLIDELRPSLSLESCCNTEKVQSKKGDMLYKHLASKFGCAPTKASMAHLWNTAGNDPVVVEYGCGDGTSTWQLWQKYKIDLVKPYFKSQVREYNLERVSEMEFKLMPVLHKMQRRGVKVNQERLNDVITNFEREADNAKRLVGDINARSPLQVRAYFEKHGITNWPTTPKKGAPSFPEWWLAQSEPGQALLKSRKYRTMLDTFLYPLSAKHTINGRVHTNFHQTRDEEFGTKTGRLSTTDPNLGAVPKRNEELAKIFRSVYEADQGHEFFEADGKAAEVRIAAHYTQAKVWIDGFWQGMDPHDATAIQMFGETNKKLRRTAKTINLGLIMGLGKPGLATQLGISIDETLPLINKYFTQLPELKKFQKDASTMFRERGFVSTLLGRRLQLADPDKDYTAMNRLTQGGCADWCKSVMVALDQPEHSDIGLSLTIYDSVLAQIEKGDGRARDKAVAKMVNMPAIGIPEFSLPFEAEYGQGKTWADASFNTIGSERWEPRRDK